MTPFGPAGHLDAPIVHALSQIRRQRGCLGAVLIRDGCVAETDLLARLDDRTLLELHDKLEALAKKAGQAGFQRGDVNLHYEHATVSRLEVCPGVVLLVLRDRTARRELIELYARAAVEEIAHTLPGAQHARDRLEPLREQLLAHHGHRLATLRHDYAEILGPIGVFLFDTHLDAWLRAGRPSWRRARDLRDRLCTEIPDPDARRRFHAHACW